MNTTDELGAQPAPAADAAGERDHLRIEVSRGGAPTSEQIAAVSVALTAASGARHDGTDTAAPRLTGWQQAALVEGVGVRRIAERADLEHPDGTP